MGTFHDFHLCKKEKIFGEHQTSVVELSWKKREKGNTREYQKKNTQAKQIEYMIPEKTPYMLIYGLTWLQIKEWKYL